MLNLLRRLLALCRVAKTFQRNTNSIKLNLECDSRVLFKKVDLRVLSYI